MSVEGGSGLVGDRGPVTNKRIRTKFSRRCRPRVLRKVTRSQKVCRKWLGSHQPGAHTREGATAEQGVEGGRGVEAEHLWERGFASASSLLSAGITAVGIGAWVCKHTDLLTA